MIKLLTMKMVAKKKRKPTTAATTVKIPNGTNKVIVPWVFLMLAMGVFNYILFL